MEQLLSPAGEMDPRNLPLDPSSEWALYRGTLRGALDGMQHQCLPSWGGGDWKEKTGGVAMVLLPETILSLIGSIPLSLRHHL